MAIADPANVRDAVAVGERLIEAVRNAPFDGPSATLSIGIAGPGPADAVPAILRAADQAMYAAKRSGKNRFIARTFDPPTDLGTYSPT